MKKAQAVWGMKEIIITVVILLVLLAFIGNLKASVSKSSKAGMCKASIKAYSSKGSLSKFFEEGGRTIRDEIDCPAEELSINNNDISKAKFQLADSMKRCWDNFWRGKLQLFSGDGVFCHPCSFIEFKNPGKPINNFHDYLATRNMPATSTKYLEFLLNNDNPDVQAAYTIDSSKPSHSVMFVYARGEDEITTARTYFRDRAYLSGKNSVWLAGIALIEFNRDELAEIGCTNLPIPAFE